MSFDLIFTQFGIKRLWQSIDTEKIYLNISKEKKRLKTITNF